MLCLSSRMLRIWSLWVLSCLQLSCAQHFRGGALQWNKAASERSVHFIFSASFTRSYGAFGGSARDQLPAVGDRIMLSGREPILFFASSSGRGTPIELEVTYIDAQQDVLHGVWKSDEVDAGNADVVVARVEGCCRYSALSHAANTKFRVFSTVYVTPDGKVEGNYSGSIGAVDVLRAVPGSAQTTFPVSHPWTPSLVDCHSEEALRCLSVAQSRACDLDTLVPTVDGVDCSPFMDSCLKPACGMPLDPPRVAVPEAVLLRTLTVGNDGIAESGFNAVQNEEACFQALQRNGIAGCQSTPGCCRGPTGNDCVACLSISSSGVLNVAGSATPGIYPLPIAMSYRPDPPNRTCVDHPRAWRDAQGLSCSERSARGLCSENVTGTAGVAELHACCECGGGSFPGGMPSTAQGLDGVYESGSCVNATLFRGNIAGQELFFNSTLKVDAKDLSVHFNYQEFMAPPFNQTFPDRNSTPPCSHWLEHFEADIYGESLGATPVSVQLKVLDVKVGHVVVQPKNINASEHISANCPCVPVNSWIVGQKTTIAGCSPANCPFLMQLGVDDSNVIAFEYRGTGGFPKEAACLAESLIEPGLRRACGWEGVSKEQCEALGCCFNGPSNPILYPPSLSPPFNATSSPFCFLKTYRDLTGSMTQMHCNATELTAGACPHHLPSPSPDYQERHALPRVAEFSTANYMKSGPPLPLATSDIIVEVLDQSTRDDQVQQFQAEQLGGITWSFTHGVSGFWSAAFESYGGLESVYHVVPEPSVWRFSKSFYPGTVQYYRHGEEARLRADWVFTPDDPDMGQTVNCFQAQIVLDCEDIVPLTPGPNCTQIFEDGVCPGLHLTAPEDIFRSSRPSNGFSQVQGIDSLCCACGGGQKRSVFTEMKCVNSVTKQDTAPEMIIAPQETVMESPCKTFVLGEPPTAETRCYTPVVHPPCRPPFYCANEESTTAVGYPRRIRETTPIDSIGQVKISNGGFGCTAGGSLAARPTGGFGQGFSATFEVATAGTFRGVSGAITAVFIQTPGAGYTFPPEIFISEGGAGCQGYSFEAVLSTVGFDVLDVWPGVGLDVEIVAGDNTFDPLAKITALDVISEKLPRATFLPAVSGPGFMSRRLVWKPLRSLAGGVPIAVCFSAEDTSGVTSQRGNILEHNKTSSACIGIRVVRCQYALGEGETLQHVAAYYQTNWLQIWALNPQLQNPDSELKAGTVAIYGHLYEVEEGGTIEKIVRKFGTTSALITTLNNDVAVNTLDVVGAGQELCVVPNSCGTNV